jgi:hypothetical protein
VRNVVWRRVNFDSVCEQLQQQIQETWVSVTAGTSYEALPLSTFFKVGTWCLSKGVNSLYLSLLNQRTTEYW